MAPSVLIVQPAPYRSKTDRRVVKLKSRRLVPLTLPYLAALTPSEWRVQLVDEFLEDVPFDTRPDLVAITTSTVTSLRAYAPTASSWTWPDAAACCTSISAWRASIRQLSAP
jgi:hypothetical protein